MHRRPGSGVTPHSRLMRRSTAGESLTPMVAMASRCLERIRVVPLVRVATTISLAPSRSAILAEPYTTAAVTG